MAPLLPTSTSPSFPVFLESTVQINELKIKYRMRERQGDCGQGTEVAAVKKNGEEKMMERDRSRWLVFNEKFGGRVLYRGEGKK